MIYAPLTEFESFFSGQPLIREFVSSLNRNIALGRKDILGDDIYASIAEYNTKPIREAVLESHREYVDIQIVLSGTELGKVLWRDGLKVLLDTPEKDLILYRRPAKFASHFILDNSVFAVFYPSDAHMTQISTASRRQKVKKVVIKVKAEFMKFHSFAG